MSTKENKALVRRFLDATNTQDVTALGQIATPEIVRLAHEEVFPFIYGTFGPDHHMEATELLAEGDQVWARVATRGGHIKEWLGIPPTDTHWTNTVILFMRLDNGRITTVDALPDIWNHVQQLGATLSPPPTVATTRDVTAVSGR